MGTEIERKFLVDAGLLGPLPTGIRIRQGYILRSPRAILRVRIKGTQGFLTLKSTPRGISRLEYEYPIPLSDAEEMLAALCESRIIEKIRHEICFAGHRWEIDQFRGHNAGLVLAEVELRSEQEAVRLPPWVTEEVSHDYRYQNANLIDHPYTCWKQT